MKSLSTLALTLWLPLSGLLAAALPAQEIFSEEDLAREMRQVLERDAFPVLFDPMLAEAAQGHAELRYDEPVIGIVLNGEARAYPISVMGSHELVNDQCGGVPIAASW